VTPVVSVSAETSIAEGGAMLYLVKVCPDFVQKIDDCVVCFKVRSLVSLYPQR
jgi:hypothetical protein